MSAQCEVAIKQSAGAPMSVFERYLTVWVFLCIVAGVLLGQALPGVFQAVGRMEYAQVNLPVGLLIWVMIIPMLVKVDFGALHEVRQHVRGIGVTLFINWLVKPFSMAFLGWLFIRQIFAPYLPADQLDSYIAGLILLAAAPCTAMVFVWSRLSNGDPLFTLSQVALNDTIMIFAFAPLVGLRVLMPPSRLAEAVAPFGAGLLLLRSSPEIENAPTLLTVPVDAAVKVTLNQSAVPEGMVFDLWAMDEASLLGNPAVAYNEESFTIPAGSVAKGSTVTVEAQYRDATIESEPSILGTAAIIGVAGAGTAVIVWQGYRIGMELYEKYFQPTPEETAAEQPAPEAPAAAAF